MFYYYAEINNFTGAKIEKGQVKDNIGLFLFIYSG